MSSRQASRKSAREVFARTMLALQPYSQEIVLIGGWVHALYLTEVDSSLHPVHTDDIDITIPRILLREGRPTLIELAIEAGFERDEWFVDGAPIRLTQTGPEGTLIDLDVITEGKDPRTAVPIEGQPDLAAQGYPDQQMLLDNPRWTAPPFTHLLIRQYAFACLL